MDLESTVYLFPLSLECSSDRSIDILEFEIVTPDAQLHTVNKYQNQDLFWALRGGGGGFGVSFSFSEQNPSHPE